MGIDGILHRGRVKEVFEGGSICMVDGVGENSVVKDFFFFK
jgi:hypothetical protein